LAKRKILSVDCYIPDDLSEFIDIQSDASLLEGDIILFNPSVREYSFSHETYLGKPALSDDRSFRLKELSEHWRRELKEAYSAGKTIFIFLTELLEVYVDTGRREYSGTGRNQKTTRIVDKFDNYNMIPLKLKVVNSQGQNMKLTREGKILANYWEELSEFSSYKVIIDEYTGIPLIMTKSGSKVLSSIIQNEDSGGSIILLPYLNLWDESFQEEIEYKNEQDPDGRSTWEIIDTDEGKIFGHKLYKCLIEIDRALHDTFSTTPTPDWCLSPEYTLNKENQINEKLLLIETKIEKLNEEKEKLKKEQFDTSLPRRLLFEKGKPLEASVINALIILGFKAEPFRDSESEFDVVFECDEGRLLGEVEGKDNSAINIDKLRQLEMNIHEDLEKEDISEPAKGALFGNAFRLKPISERKEFFTQKCKTAAMRNKTALVRTPDLFKIVQYLNFKNDNEFAKKCRLTLINSKGGIIKFPDVPNEKIVTRILSRNDT